METVFTQGGINYYTDSTPGFDRSGYHGWMGLGGSVFQWHLDLNLSFAYVPSLLQFVDMVNWRGAKLQQIAAECAKGISI